MKIHIYVFFMVVLLSGVGFVVHTRSTDTPHAKYQNLLPTLDHIPNWRQVGVVDMDEKIVTALELDDFVFQVYSNGEHAVTLYIGYYHSASKVGAAHDPMVCFPGQGWKIHKTGKGVAHLANQDIDAFPYATITAALSEQSEFLLYWFQAHDKPAATTLMQKLLLLKRSILGKGQNNAFVRLSMACPGADTAQCEQTLLEFVDDFYPVFLDLITSEGAVTHMQGNGNHDQTSEVKSLAPTSGLVWSHK